MNCVFSLINICLFFSFIFRGVTHKKTIIEYCETKIKKATINDELVDRASYILLYQLMIMLIQQNGVNIHNKLITIHTYS